MAVYRGTGIIWDGENNKPLCKFVDGRFETSNKRIIGKLKDFEGVTLIGGDVENEEVEDIELNLENNYSELNKKDLVKIAKESGVKGADRMSKEEIIESLEC